MLFVVALLGLAFQGPIQDPPPVFNLVSVSNRFCVAGQPSTVQFADLKRSGFRAVVNLREDGERDAAADGAAARAAGLKYFHIPVPFRAPRDGDVEAFLRVADDEANLPLLIHCAVNLRASAFWMIRRVLRENWTVADAEAEARRNGLGRSPHLIAYATEYVDRARRGRR